MSQKTSSQTINKSDGTPSPSKRKVYVKIVALCPGQTLSNVALSDYRDTVILKSDKQLYNLLETLSKANPSSLGNAGRISMKFWNQESNTWYLNIFGKLSELDEDVGTLDNPLVLTYVDFSKEMPVYVKIIELSPNQKLSEDMISKLVADSNAQITATSLKSDKNLINFIEYVKTIVDPKLKDVAFDDFQLWSISNPNPLLLQPIKNKFLELSSLANDGVGTIDNPLVLTYVDRTITEIPVYLKIIELSPNQKLSEDIISNEKQTHQVSLKMNKSLTALITRIKLLFPTSLGNVNWNDIELWRSNPLPLKCYFSFSPEVSSLPEDFSNMKLSSLSDNAGKRDNPLVLTYVDRTITGRKLKDGIPELQQNLSLSSPSVPSEKEHKSCDRTEMALPFFPPVSENVLNAANSIWEEVHTRSSDGVKVLSYSSEADIAYIVKRYLVSILLALDLPLNFNAEVTIKEIRPDLCVLLMGIYLVGVVEVKKPGRSVLGQPTVLGELMDQMLLVEGFYGMGPAIGILTTAEEWLVSWFPVDSETLAGVNPTEEASFTTPMKQKSSSTSTETKGHSPPGGTPSQQSGIIHCIGQVTDASLEIDDGVTQEMERRLCTTRVMNIYEDPICVLQHLCGAFQLMSKAHLHHTANLPRCLLKFHKGSPAVTFHPMSHDDVNSKVDYNKYPYKNVKTLVALEDLGRGSTGKAWLCVTVTKSSSAICVLKFDNKHSQSERLRKEKKMWHYIYPEFASMVKIQQWSGAEALVMPHFSTILESERDQYKAELREVLISHFFKKGLVHLDVRWRNIGKYKNKKGAVFVVVYDLYDVVEYNVNDHLDWIDKAMQSLFVHV